MSRTKNTLRNVNSGLINRMVMLLLPFINRTAILWILGAEFTGLASLFSSILSVLNIAELGFNTAIVYSLYEPMADKNTEKICEIVSIFRKIYRIIGMVIFGVGMVIMPFLKFFIQGSYPENVNIYLLYFFELINASISYYLFAYKECLLIADQRQDIGNNIRTIVSIFRYLLQFFVLLFLKNYYIYLLVAIIGTIATNLCIQYMTKKNYPYFHQIEGNNHIPQEIVKNVKGLMINKICDTFRNSFDSLIISMLMGLTAAAIYGNYYYIFSSIYGIMLVISNGMSASIGNSIVTNNEKKNYNDMLSFCMIYAWIFGWCTVCLACLYQPFMKIWVGENLMLPTLDMLLFCLYFYLINMNNIRNQYISGTGLWWKLKGSYIVEAAANLVLNFLLGKWLGMTGVLLATILTIFIFNYMQRNWILFKNYFKQESLGKFLVEQFYYAIITGVAIAITFPICYSVNSDGITGLLLRIIICLFVPNIILLIGFSIIPRFQVVKKFALGIIKSKIK